MNPSPDQEFEVSISGTVRDLLTNLHDRADACGQRDDFLGALHAISARLRCDPVRFGEEVFDLSALHLTVKVGIVLPVVVEFAIYPNRRLVFIRTFRYVPPA